MIFILAISLLFWTPHYGSFMGGCHLTSLPLVGYRREESCFFKGEFLSDFNEF